MKNRPGFKYLQQGEVDRFFSVITRPRDRALFAVAFWRGLRASEIGSLDLGSVDLQRERISIRRLKGSYPGEYRLSPFELEALRRWLRVRGDSPGPLFPSRRGRPISRYQIFLLMRKYGAAAGLPPDKSSPRVLKHTIATVLLDRGLDLADVKDWLGHVSIKNTAIYAQVTSRRREEAARKAYEVSI